MGMNTTQASTRPLALPNDYLKRIDLRRMYPQKHGNPIMVHCPAHDDTGKPNLAVYRSNVYCFHPTCHYHDGAFGYIKKVMGYTRNGQVVEYMKTLLTDTVVESLVSVRQHNIPLDRLIALEYRNTLNYYPESRKWLKKKYGFTDATISNQHIGHTHKYPWAFTIPVYDIGGNLMNVRFRVDPTMQDETMRYWGMKGRNNTTLFIPPALLPHGESLLDMVDNYGVTLGDKPMLWLTEGEMDSFALMQWGLAAVSTTNGARAFTGEIDDSVLEALRPFRVLVCYDQDETGVEMGRKVRDRLKAAGIDASQRRWKGSWGKDASELLAKGFDGQTFAQTGWFEGGLTN